MILKLYIIGFGGILCYSKSFFRKIEIDEEILSGFLTAFSDFAREIKGGEVKALLFREFNFIYSYSVKYNLIFIVVIDKDDLEEEAKIKVELMKIEFINKYKRYLDNWSGDISVFEDFDNFVEENIFIPLKILMIGELGVGKTTIIELFSGETIIELDDELNEIIHKSVKFTNLNGIKECTIREVDLNKIANNFNLYKDLLTSSDIVLIVSNSAASNLGRTQELLSKLKPKFQKADLYLIANFQDLEDTAFKPQKIEETFNIKTYGFSAIKDGSKNKIISVLREILKNYISNKQDKKFSRIKQDDAKINSVEQIKPEETINIEEINIDYTVIWDQIEAAKILERQGDYISAAEKFSCVADQFKELCSPIENRQDNDELNAIYYLCKAWESMELAEEHKDPNRYAEAVDLFNRSSDYFTDSKYKSLALGNAAFCQALELGSKFDKSTDKTEKAGYYPEIKMMLRNAANSYRKGGFENEADWALATSTYFDATWYIISADEELKLDEKKRLLDIVVGMLKSAAQLFKKAGYKNKEKEVIDRLELVKKEEKIITSALNTISEPSLSKSTLKNLTPTLSEKTSKRIKDISGTQKKYKLLYKDLMQKYSEIQKRKCRIGIAQIGVSSSGDLLNEFYEEKGSGLIGIKTDKIDLVQKKIRLMIEQAYSKGINILVFPEMSVDLNYGKILEELSDLAKSYEMYIIPGSFHNIENNRNVCKVIGPEGILWEQEKHIPALIHFQSKKFEEGIDVGTLPRKTIVCNTEYGRIAIVICRDFLDMDLRVELKNFEPPIDIILNPAYTPVTADFKAAHFDARRSIYAYCFFVNIAEYGESLIYTPEKDRIERIIPPKEESLIYKDLDLFKLRSERKKWEIEKNKKRHFIQSTR